MGHFFFTRNPTNSMPINIFKQDFLVKRYPLLKQTEFLILITSRNSDMHIRKMFVWSFLRGINFHILSALQVCLSKKKLNFIFLFFLKKHYHVLDLALFVAKKHNYYFLLLDRSLKTRFLKFFIFNKVVFFMPLVGLIDNNFFIRIHFCFLFFFFSYYFKYWVHFFYKKPYLLGGYNVNYWPNLI